MSSSVTQSAIAPPGGGISSAAPPQGNTPNLRKRTRTSKYNKYSSTSPTTPSTQTNPSTTLYSPSGTSTATTATTTSFAAKRRAIKSPEMKLPEKISTFIPESKMYTSLLDFEKKLDIALARRQLDVQEALRVRNFQRVTKTIRLTIYNTYMNQSAFYHTDNKTQLTVGEPPSWTLRIEGRILDEAPTWSRSSQKAPRRKFSSFIKKAFFQIGNDPSNPNTIVEWERSQASGDTDGWEIKRGGNKEIDVKIVLFLEHSPSKVKVISPELSQLLNLSVDTRPRIIMSLWQYIKANKLLDPNDRKTIINDENLRKIFACDTMQFNSLPQLLREHLGPPDPIEIPYTIRLSGDPSEYAQCYDLQVEADDSVAIQASPQYKKEIANIDEQILQVISQIQEHKRKREFMLGFHNDPIGFMNQLINNQIRDYKLLRSAQGRDPEEERQTSFFLQPYIDDATHSFISKHANANQQPTINMSVPASAVIGTLPTQQFQQLQQQLQQQQQQQQTSNVVVM
jgi:SWI/SNF-related matrix-associated actin-dependent regulator of chromatin subfamily D